MSFSDYKYDGMIFCSSCFFLLFAYMSYWSLGDFNRWIIFVSMVLGLFTDHVHLFCFGLRSWRNEAGTRGNEKPGGSLSFKFVTWSWQGQLEILHLKLWPQSSNGALHQSFKNLIAGQCSHRTKHLGLAGKFLFSLWDNL